MNWSKKETRKLLPIITKVVRPGSIIHSDEWRAYNAISETGIYEHKKIAHKYNFVNPETGTHAQLNHSTKLNIILKWH